VNATVLLDGVSGRQAEARAAPINAAIRSSTWSLEPFILSAEHIAVIQAVAIHAGITARQHQQQRHSLESGAPAMAVNLKAAAAWALPNARPGFPHLRYALQSVARSIVRQ
jgi:hypothetical protein